MQDKINILDELKEIGANILTITDNENYFSVPENYFSNLTGDILTHVFIKSLPVQNPYYLPSGYFENFSEILLEKLQVERNIGFSKKTGYTIPENYFDSLAGNILKKIKSSFLNSAQQELEELSPLLSSISKANVYSVPENYFEQLKPVNEVQENVLPAAKVISIGRTRKWSSYAVAACLAAFLFGGGYLYFSDKKSVTQVSQTYSPLAEMNVQKEISSLSDDEINSYLKDNNNIAVYTNTIDTEQQSIDIETLLQNVSDEEIQQYLIQDPESSKTGGGI